MYTNSYETYSTNPYYSSHQNYNPYNSMMYHNSGNMHHGDNSDDRILGPLLLGGLAGAALAPAFYGPRPFYGGYPYPMYPPFPYRPCC